MHFTEKPLRVLFVDDDASIRTIAQIGLKGLTEWYVVTAESGPEALRLAKESVPDLILLDVMMPGMDGKETLAKLQEGAALNKVPVIFITAKVQPQEVLQYIALGAAGVIAKPFDPMSLPDEIETILTQAAKKGDLTACCL